MIDDVYVRSSGVENYLTSLIDKLFPETSGKSRGYNTYVLERNL